MGTERRAFDRNITDRSYYFATFDLNYNLIPNKLKIGLMGSNLLGTEQFVISHINELMYSTTKYALHPRLFMLSFEYRH